MLGTEPSARRRGAGGLQLQWGLEIADRMSLVCWLDASPMSVSLYKKYGFVEVGTVAVELDAKCGGGHYTHTCMMREPRRSQSE